MLRDVGCRVVESCNGLDEVEAASRERPQFILMALLFNIDASFFIPATEGTRL
jgi:hypothetical protein